MKYTYSFNGKSVFFFCSDTMKDTAEFFSTVLQHEDTMYDVIKNNRTIQIGWGSYKVLQADSAYQMLACDLLSDPFQAVTDDLSLSLEIFAKQRIVLSVTKAAPKETSFQDTLIVQRAAVKAPRVYLKRDEPGNSSDSGWYMGAIGVKASNDPSEYAQIYTYQLLKFCKVALSVMQLPIGTICVFENGNLIEIVDKNNNKIF
ncbi:hypothetical protein [uncultured Dysosmobacter sp.]|uniref:immunity protein Imm33 domain-containing protein n=1 Tax=uncultured Dysosmobacter sp. TaxID=2591384 RepID=UPI00260AC059|nr:hypothetical protein [uncultured Dysosmobacter sp.]